MEFGHVKVALSQIFLESRHSFACVNLKPVLSETELSDLWLVAQRVSVMLKKKHETDSVTFAVQDGPLSGQTIAHVHVHIIPRRKGDFNPNDEVYRKIEEKGREERSEGDMAAEAEEYRKLV